MMLHLTPCTAPLQEKHSRKTGENTTNRAFLFVNLRLRPPYFRMKGAEMSMKSVTPLFFWRRILYNKNDLHSAARRDKENLWKN